MASLLLAAAWIKLAGFGDNALDLGIFRQVLHQTVQGNLFGLTIHPHSYLGDHIDVSLLAFAPLYALAPSAFTPLAAQIGILVLSVWPLTRLAARYGGQTFQLLTAVALLFSPFLHNAALFEFHTFVLLIPLLLGAAAAYEEGQGRLFAVLLGLALLVREDVGLLVAGFSFLAWADRRPRAWRLLPLAAGLAWFAGAVSLTSVFNHDQYKFLAYYGWLGPTFSDALLKAVTQPWVTIIAVFRAQNVLFALAALLLAAGLPLLAARKLLPVALFTLALFLTGFGGDTIAFRTHYMAAFFPFLLWAAMAGIARLRTHPPRWMMRYAEHPHRLAMLLLLGTTLYGALTFGPLGPAGIRRLAAAYRAPERPVAEAMLNRVGSDAHVAASYAFLPFVADRDAVYSLHYAFTGTRQLSSLPYVLPEDTDTVLFDSRDFLSYTVQYEHDEKKFLAGDNRLRAVIERGFLLQDVADSFLLYTKTRNVPARPALYTVGGTVQGTNVAQLQPGPIRLVAQQPEPTTLAVETERWHDTSVQFLPLTLTWQADVSTLTTYHMMLRFVDAEGRLQYERRYPMAYGLYPTTEWQPGVPVAARYRFLVPRLSAGRYTVQLQLAYGHGYATLDDDLSAKVEYTEEERLGTPVELGTITAESHDRS